MQNLFTYPLKLEDMSQAAHTYKLKATPEELKFITEVMKVPAVKSFEAEIVVKLQAKKHLADVSGKVCADVEHVSVISLENFVRRYETEFALKFDTKMTPEEYRSLEPDVEEDVPDILDHGQIDLAAIAMEQLALVLDDFPRREGEAFSFVSEFDDEASPQDNPFLVLKKLKK